MPPSAGDVWSEWLLDRRDGGDQRQRRSTSDYLEGIRDRVLSVAEPLAGASLLDVGTGDGLVGLAAIERVGAGGHVTFSDVSPALLQEARKHVHARGLEGRASFVVASAEDLAPVESGSMDVVTTRSVLIYVDDKRRALGELHRVLRPGGRISLAEPINRLMFPEPEDRLWGYDVAPVRSIAARVKAEIERSDRAAQSLTDFDDRDLAQMAESAGFERIELACHTSVVPRDSLMRATSVETLLRMAPNPLAPTLGEAVERCLSPAESTRLLDQLRSAIARQAAVRRSVIAFLVAEKAEN